MGITSYYQGIKGTGSSTPVSSGSGITSYYNNLSEEQRKKSLSVISKPKVTTPVIQPTLLSKAKDTIQKAKDTFIKKPVIEPLKLDINQIKLKPTQLKELNLGGREEIPSAQLSKQVQKTQLKRVEEPYKEPGVLGSMVEALKESTVQSASGIGASIEMVGKIRNNIILTKVGQKLDKEATRILKANPEWAADPMEKWGTKKVARLVTAAVPSLLAVIGATLVAGPIGGVATGFMLEAGSTYKESLASGKSEKDAQNYGTIVGTVNSILENIFPSKLLKKPTAEVVKKISKSVAKDVLEKVAKFGIKIAKDGTLEGSTEALQELWSNVIATNYDKNRKIWDNLLESFVGGFGAGGVTGTVIKGKEEVDVKKMIEEGEHTPQEVIGKVISEGIESTPQGKTLVKQAVEAQKQGKNVVIEKPPQPPVEGGVSKEIGNVQKATNGEWFVSNSKGDITGWYKTEQEALNNKTIPIPKAFQESDYKIPSSKGNVTLYRGISQTSPIKGNYFTLDKEYASQFTQTGRESEINKISVPLKDIYKPKTLPDTTQVEQMDKTIAEAKSKGYKAFFAGEGGTDKPSVFFIDKIDSRSYKSPSVVEGGVGGGVSPTVKKTSGGEVEKGVIEPQKVSPKAKVEKTNEFQSRVFERIKAEHPDLLQGELTYEKTNLKKDLNRAIDLIKTDKQKAFDLAMRRESTSEVLSTSANIALAEKALDEGIYSLYNKLIRNRSIEQTKRGKEISAERGSVNDNSMSRYVKELISARLDNIGKRYLSGLREGKISDKEHATKVIERKAMKLDRDIKNGKLNAKTALRLLDELTCLT